MLRPSGRPELIGRLIYRQTDRLTDGVINDIRSDMMFQHMLLCCVVLWIPKLDTETGCLYDIGN